MPQNAAALRSLRTYFARIRDDADCALALLDCLLAGAGEKTCMSYGPERDAGDRAYGTPPSHGRDGEPYRCVMGCGRPVNQQGYMCFECQREAA